MLKKEDSEQGKLLSGSALPKSRDVEDNFDFGVKRTTKPDKVDNGALALDLIDDSANGKWSGWVYTASLTERNPLEKLSLAYMSVDKLFVSFANSRKESPFLKYITMDLKWPCKGIYFLIFKKGT